MANNTQVEIEAKIAVEDLKAVEEQLKRLGAGKKGEYLETDSFFDYNDQRLKLSDSALRLRDRRNLDSGQSNYRLTFKGPRQPGPFKHRRETEISVDGPEKTSDLLDALGLKVFARYTKRRNSWSVENCSIEVDFLEGIGQFVEVEGPDEESIRKVLGLLNLSDKPVIQESYLAMVLRHGQGIVSP
jgi:adenylate cyclase, class 2